MAYYHTVKLIRASGAVTKHFSDFDYDKQQFNPRGQVDDFIHRAIKMPKTVRVEVTETDTQLYGYPFSERSYQRAVVLKDGRAYQFYGKNCPTAFLHDGPLHSLHIA
jgi:hypothetical protein